MDRTVRECDSEETHSCDGAPGAKSEEELLVDHLRISCRQQRAHHKRHDGEICILRLLLLFRADTSRSHPHQIRNHPQMIIHLEPYPFSRSHHPSFIARGTLSRGLVCNAKNSFVSDCSARYQRVVRNRILGSIKAT